MGTIVEGELQLPVHCVLTSVSGHPDIDVVSLESELLQVPARDPMVLNGVEKAIRRAGRVVDDWVDARTSRLFLLECTCDRYRCPWNVIEAHECWDAPPVVFQDGWAHLRVLSFDASKPRALFQDLQKRGPAELVREGSSR